MSNNFFFDEKEDEIDLLLDEDVENRGEPEEKENENDFDDIVMEELIDNAHLEKIEEEKRKKIKEEEIKYKREIKEMEDAENKKREEKEEERKWKENEEKKLDIINKEWENNKDQRQREIYDKMEKTIEQYGKVIWRPKKEDVYKDLIEINKSKSDENLIVIRRDINNIRY